MIPGAHLPAAGPPGAERRAGQQWRAAAGTRAQATDRLPGKEHLLGPREQFAYRCDRGALGRLDLRPTQRVHDLLGRVTLPAHDERPPRSIPRRAPEVNRAEGAGHCAPPRFLRPPRLPSQSSSGFPAPVSTLKIAASTRKPGFDSHWLHRGGLEKLWFGRISTTLKARVAGRFGWSGSGAGSSMLSRLLQR
jgi:hypothetical protein